MDKYKKGFTIIELLVIIALLSIILTITFVVFNNYKDKVKDNAIGQYLTDIKIHAEIFYLEKQVYINFLPGITSNPTYTGLCARSLTSPYDNDKLLSKYTPVDTLIGKAVSLTGGNYISPNPRGGMPNGGYSFSNCFLSRHSYAIAVKLKSDSNKSYCVDSSGFSKALNYNFNNAILGNGNNDNPYKCKQE